MDVSRVESLLREQLQSQNQSKTKSSTPGPTEAFQDLLRESSERSNAAGEAAERFVTIGEGELHNVQIELAKADVTFRFLLEVRNKLTEAYQEISRLNI